MWDPTSDAGDRALKDECPATSEELEEKCSKATSDSRRVSPNGETQTFQWPQILISGGSRHYLPIEKSAKEIQAGQRRMSSADNTRANARVLSAAMRG